MIAVFEATYLRPPEHETGTFLICSEEADKFDGFLMLEDIKTKFNRLKHPTTSEPLPSIRPVDGVTLDHVEREQGIKHGDQCIITVEGRNRRGKPALWFITAILK